MVLIDMSKAFDKMDPNKPLTKLKSLGTNDGLLHLINYFWTDSNKPLLAHKDLPLE